MTIRVGFSTIWYPVAMGRYIFEALRRRSDVELYTAGPYSGRWIPWGGGTGMHLPMSYVHRPDLPMSIGPRPEMMYALVEKSMPWQADVWIEANAGLTTYGRPSCKYIVVGTDPHVLDYAKAREKADLFFGMQKPYLKPGDRWLPYGYDPVWHSPTAIPFAEREYDAALLGLHYPNRNLLVDHLRRLGKKVAYELGPAYDDAKRIYHSTRVGLNWSSMQDTTARVFEVMAFGIAPVLNRVPDLAEMFQEGRDFLSFTTEGEACANVVWLLDHPKEASELGERARLAVAPHTWDARVDQLLREARVL
jgi:glycosyltransferase involved in cell wall biosynthesis